MTVSELDEGIDAVFPKSAYVNDDLKKLKKPIPLKVVIDEDNTLILSNSKFKILVTCTDIIDGCDLDVMSCCPVADIGILKKN